MKRIGLPLGAIMLTLGLSLSACSSGPPSKDDIVDTLTEDDAIPKDVAECIADKILDSDLSDDQLNALDNDADDSGLSDEDEAEVTEVISAASVECASK
jgi:hypothetical protein